MTAVAVVVPWRGGCAHRERALEWLRGRFAAGHPDWRVIVAEAHIGPWVKASVVMPAVDATDAEIIVVSDADVLCPGLSGAVAAIEAGAAWAIPHRLVRRLSAGGTAAVLAGEQRERQPLDQPPYEGIEGGGIVLARREMLLEVPMDPRFAGWGQEDESHGLALRCMLGPPWRGTADLTHLWHPPQERWTRRRGSRENWRLYGRYRQARHDPEAMRGLLRESEKEQSMETITSQNPGFGDFGLYRKKVLSRISNFTVPPGTAFETPEGLKAEDEKARVAFDSQGGVYPIRESVFQETYEPAG